MEGTAPKVHLTHGDRYAIASAVHVAIQTISKHTKEFDMSGDEFHEMLEQTGKKLITYAEEGRADQS